MSELTNSELVGLAAALGRARPLAGRVEAGT
jgi:hypothetical protein